ncbi:hypothetical protein [Sinomonas sp. ASV322]|uniref:hypothetical protein n=1 Tax=Sinomonas sp. ASV322 TaxID=3041920 RepID=UPI0027DCA849|nr:hypothetical protein [Sinomonas sp. ASV322]MDQ4501236.1 hypothetical protein [Sinomonas sp. ASV322]
MAERHGHRPLDRFAIGGAAYRRSPGPRQAVVEQFEIFMGFVGFWAVILLVVTVWLELTGQPALWWALGLAASLVAIGGLWALRRRVLRGNTHDAEH